jgi:hypothetical protein
MEILFFVVLAALTIIPLWTLLPHFGINKLWSLAALIPLGLIVLLWIMAGKIRNGGAA